MPENNYNSKKKKRKKKMLKIKCIVFIELRECDILAYIKPGSQSGEQLGLYAGMMPQGGSISFQHETQYDLQAQLILFHHCK